MPIPEKYQEMVKAYNDMKQDITNIRERKNAAKKDLKEDKQLEKEIDKINKKLEKLDISVSLEELLDNYYESSIEALRETYNMLKERYEQLLLEYGD